MGNKFVFFEMFFVVNMFLVIIEVCFFIDSKNDKRGFCEKWKYVCCLLF